jgi:GTP-binding protein EngB required for normal cell division
LYNPAGDTLQGKTGEQYIAVEDFHRCPPDQACKRMVVIGCTGAGKSTLLNVLGGSKLVQSEGAHGLSRTWSGQQPVFSDKPGTDSVTQETSFAFLKWVHNPEHMFMAIDTPGYDDTAGVNTEDGRSKTRALLADLHNKLKALGHIHTILICHDQVSSNRLNQATLDVLQVIVLKASGWPLASGT